MYYGLLSPIGRARSRFIENATSFALEKHSGEYEKFMKSELELAILTACV
jgi:hypothetical protein